MADVVAISSGRYHSLALKSDGSVWAWGDIDYSTIIWSGIPVRISELTNVVAISAGSYYSVALKSDGSAWAWGYNNSGELGDGTVIQRTLPVQVNYISNIISISAGNMHSLALRSDGTVWAWGYNSQGELGNGTTTNNSTTPVQSAKLTDVVAISAGGFHSLALKSDGTVWAWGDDIYSELGDGVIKYYTMSNVPVQTYKLNGIVAIDAGLYHSMALK
jgi:alpha-tubulin suppressor-like RCC1 family protein